jgi:D-lactate dehydrogenase
MTVPLVRNFDAVSAFVHDVIDDCVLGGLQAHGVNIVALRCAGFNNVNLESAKQHGITIVRVPAYSPHAVAEHAVALMLALNRNIHRAHNRVREGNFALDGLLGFDLYGKTIGIVGTGRIGCVLAGIMRGFGCEILAFDPHENEELKKTGVRYVDHETLLQSCDIISLHCPLTPETKHFINAESIRLLRPETMIINTSRGGVIDTLAAIEGLKSGQIGSLGIDVYEEEDALFFEDRSDKIITDDTFARLLTFPNVLITGHQAFFTREALQNIARTTIGNITACEEGKPLENEVKVNSR